MNKIEKALAKLPKDYRLTFDLLMLRLLARDFLGLNIAKMKNQKDVYRVRQGRLRIIFTLGKDDSIVLDVGLRSEKTYRNF